MTEEGEFHNKYLGWGCFNKCGYIDLENIGSVCNTMLNALTSLSIAEVEVLWTILFLVKSTEYL